MYKGFSTVASTAKKKFTLTDKSLIKQDLLNAFNIRLGSVPMQPQIGCIIWDMLFENMTKTQLNDVAENVTNIVSADPRLRLQKLDVSTTNNTLTVTLKVSYVTTNEVETMKINFNSQNSMAAFY